MSFGVLIRFYFYIAHYKIVYKIVIYILY